MIEREKFMRIFNLTIKQPWLTGLGTAVDSLFSECDSDEQAHLLVDLLDRFSFLTSDAEQSLHHSIVRDIVQLGLEEADAQIVALAADENPDSSQYIVYALKPVFARSGWRQVQILNQYSKTQRHVREKRKIIFVDEFVGTGRTIVGRVNSLKRDFLANKQVDDAEFYAFFYAGMKDAQELLNNSGLFRQVVIYNPLPKGISQVRRDHEAQLKIMGELEDKLCQMIDGSPLPRLGDGACEALYGRQGGNCPNSVFPIFWWPLNVKREFRETVLVRRL